MTRRITVIFSYKKIIAYQGLLIVSLTFDEMPVLCNHDQICFKVLLLPLCALVKQAKGVVAIFQMKIFYKLWLLLTSVLTLFARQTVFQVTSWCSCFPASCEIISISMTSIIFTKWRKLKNKAGFATIWWRSLH